MRSWFKSKPGIGHGGGDVLPVPEAAAPSAELAANATTDKFEVSDLIFELLRSDHVVKDFDCGDSATNTYLKDSLGKPAARVHVAIASRGKSKEVLGFYSLSPGTTPPDSVPSGIREDFGKENLPTIVIRWLGVDMGSQAKGLGEILVRNALGKIKEVSERTAFVALVVAMCGKANASQVWADTGFTAGEGDKKHLHFLRVQV